MPVNIKPTPDMLRCIMDAKMVIQGERRENGVVRQAAQTIDCSVFGGIKAEMMEDADGDTDDRYWNVLIIRSDWLDHKIPQKGDKLTIAGYPVMTVRSVIVEDDIIDFSTRSAAVGV